MPKDDRKDALPSWRRQELEAFMPDQVPGFLSRSIPPKDPLVTGLLHRRDLVALGARRRHGKTNLALNLAVSLAEPAPDFLGYPIPQARKTLLVLVEDDPGELQDRLRKLVKDEAAAHRIFLVTREDFYKHGVRIDVADPEFQYVVRRWAQGLFPDVIVLDNLAHLINAEYNDSKRIHELQQFVYKLASDFNAAVICAAHPKKDLGDPKDRTRKISLENDSEMFFESIMGSSHFINSMGSLWGLERDRKRDVTIFVGGRQRGDGQEQTTDVAMGEDGRLRVVDDPTKNLRRVTDTEKRKAAWDALPEPPTTFSYSEAERFISGSLKSSSTRAEWIRELRRLNVLVDTPDGRLTKAPGLRRSSPNLEVVVPKVA